MKYIVFIINFFIFFLLCSNANALGSLIAAAILAEGTAAWIVSTVAFAINMVASTILSSLLAPDAPNANIGSLPNPGSRQQIPPAGDNKLPVVYGNAYIGGTIIDLSITEDNQCIYYVIALSEVTGVDSPDSFAFGDIYWGGKKVVIDYPVVTIGSNSGGQTICPLLGPVTILSLGNTPQSTWNLLAGTSGVTYTIGSVFTAVITGDDIPEKDRGTGTMQENTNGLPYEVASLYDVSADQYTDVLGCMRIFLYTNGSSNPYNSNFSAIDVMSQVGDSSLSDSSLIYTWDSTKLMSNACFAIIQILYNSDKAVTGLNQTKFQVKNTRNLPGDCFLDYLTNTRYGAAISKNLIDQTSLQTLNDYSLPKVVFTDSLGQKSTIQRYSFDGAIDTTQKIMQNIQSMADSCNCLVKYNEVLGLWGVIVQQPLYTVAMDLNDSNVVGPISISPIDISNTYNIIEAKFPDGNNQDSFASATYDLAKMNPSLLFPNEPVNKQTVTMYLVNNSVRAAYLANIYLESAREDFQVVVSTNYLGLQLEAGDIVTLTNTNYGWTKKLFRILKVTQTFINTGEITCTLMLSEFNPAVFDDKDITQLALAPNTGLSLPSTWSTTISAPTIGSLTNSSATIPNFNVSVKTPAIGITQYAEIWYSPFQTPTSNQLLFYGTTAIAPNGNPYKANTTLTVNITGLESGDYYFFTRMINNFSTSSYSLASSVVSWRPTTFQFNLRYILIAYADSADGVTNFSLTKTSRSYFGLLNSDSSLNPITPSSYQWYSVNKVSNGRFTNFGLDTAKVYVIFANRGNRLISFNIDIVASVGTSTKLVPITTSDFDTKTWQAV